jgi:3-oxoacyl-[acyl-carrier-protein] synthase-3
VGKRVTFRHAKVTAVSSAYGGREISIDDEAGYYESREQLERLKRTIGFDRRWVVDGTVTSADLCLQAARELMDRCALEAADFDAVVFVTQTPDYCMPGNAHVLHRALSLPRSCIAFDLVYGCSGYVKGLFLAFMLAEQGFRRILVLTGDTLSRIIDVRNRADAPVFGDAGCATVVERCDGESPSWFCLYSDGSGLETMWQQAGAYRCPSSEETRREIVDEKGNVRCRDDFYMNGFEVFNFTLTEQPPLLRDILEYSGCPADGVDFFVFHQANRYIIETIVKKAGIPLAKAPRRTFSEFGNQSSASIPFTICNELSEALEGKRARMVLQGFGIGLSWGACLLDFDGVTILEPRVCRPEGSDGQSDL